MHVFVTGARGQLASALVRIATGRPTLKVTAIGRPSLDLEHPKHELIAHFAPDVIVNTAAYTAVDLAESNEALAFRINADGAGAIARSAAALGIPIIQISTDYVFSGTKLTPYKESDAVGPLNAYGRSKLSGEGQVADANPHHVIIRTSWIYSDTGNNFLCTMLRLASSQARIDVVDDQFGSPTSADDIAAAIIDIADQLVRNVEHRLYGIFHMTAAGDTSWYGFAREIFAESARLGGPSPLIHPITTADYERPARRPPNSRLDCEKIFNAFGVRLPPWRQSLRPLVAAALDSD